MTTRREKIEWLVFFLVLILVPVILPILAGIPVPPGP